MINDLWYKNCVFLLPVRRDLHGQRRRRDRRLQGLGPAARLSRGHGHRRDLADAVPDLTGRDDGYDVADYYAVDPRFGTLGDFVEFTHGARQRGIRVIIDLVVNHTSIDHPWFQAARADPNAPTRDWYVWSKKKPANAETGLVFPGVQKTTWTFDHKAREYYFHRFYDHQPDLDTANRR